MQKYLCIMPVQYIKNGEGLGAAEGLGVSDGEEVGKGLGLGDGV